MGFRYISRPFLPSSLPHPHQLLSVLLSLLILILGFFELVSPLCPWDYDRMAHQCLFPAPVWTEEHCVFHKRNVCSSPYISWCIPAFCLYCCWCFAMNIELDNILSNPIPLYVASYLCSVHLMDGRVTVLLCTFLLYSLMLSSIFLLLSICILW